MMGRPAIHHPHPSFVFPVPNPDWLDALACCGWLWMNGLWMNGKTDSGWSKRLMRILTLCISLLIVGWLVIKQLQHEPVASAVDSPVQLGDEVVNTPRNSREVEQVKNKLDNLMIGTSQKQLDYVDKASGQ
jgi:hypothetical protein